MTDIDWNQWRRNYATMDFEDQKKFYEDVVIQYPQQKSFNKTIILAYLVYANPKHVIELGGWTGDLASLTLTRKELSLSKWYNYDLVQFGNSTSFYQEMSMDSFFWDIEQLPICDTFIATHTIEHLSEEHLDLLIKRLAQIPELQTCIIEIPNPIEGKEGLWKDYGGSHILELGQDDIMQKFVDDAGFVPVCNMKGCLLLEKLSCESNEDLVKAFLSIIGDN